MKNMIVQFKVRVLDTLRTSNLVTTRESFWYDCNQAGNFEYHAMLELDVSDNEEYDDDNDTIHFRHYIWTQDKYDTTVPGLDSMECNSVRLNRNEYEWLKKGDLENE